MKKDYYIVNLKELYKLANECLYTVVEEEINYTYEVYLNVETLTEQDKIDYINIQWKKYQKRIDESFHLEYLPKVLISNDIMKSTINFETFKIFSDEVFQFPVNVDLTLNYDEFEQKINNELFVTITDLTHLEYLKFKRNELNTKILDDKNKTSKFNSKVFINTQSERFFKYVVNEWIINEKEPQVYINFLFRQLWYKDKELTETIINEEYTIHCTIKYFENYCNTNLNLKKPITKTKTYFDIGGITNKQKRLKTLLDTFKNNGSKIE